jgi:hypothetical protein
MPPIPRGLSTLWLGPATNPSSDIEILKRSLDTFYLAENIVAVDTGAPLPGTPI